MIFIRDIKKGFFNRQKTLPIWRPSYLIGIMSIDILRYIVAATIIIGCALLMGSRPEGGATGIILGVGLLIIFAFCFSWIWNTLAFILKDDGALTVISTMIVLPMIFLSSAIVDPDTMPTMVRTFVELNPISVVIDAVRGLIHGNIYPSSIFMTLIISFIIVLLFAPLTMYLYDRE